MQRLALGSVALALVALFFALGGTSLAKPSVNG